MNIPRDGIRNRVLRVWVVRLLVLAFAFRALIPVGYMPDFSALSNGVLKVVICTANGSKTVDIDADGKLQPANPNAHDHHPCAFTGLAAIDLPQPHAVVVKHTIAVEAVLIARLAVVLPPVRAGPQLGSRGPPSTS
ncbi:MAG: DUF2946 family protein [Hyphomicrobium sp.]